MTKLKAIKYLYENNVYRDEWTGAGMWEAVESVLDKKGIITKKYLNELLKQADNF